MKVNQKNNAKLTPFFLSLALRNCLSDRAIISNPYMGENYCKSTFGNIDPSPNCSLPKGRAESIGQANKDAQQRCLAEAKSGM